MSKPYIRRIHVYGVRRIRMSARPYGLPPYTGSDEWVVSMPSAVREEKQSFLHNHLEKVGDVEFEGFYEQIFWDWADPMVLLFKEASAERVMAKRHQKKTQLRGGYIGNFDTKRGVKEVTYDALWTILLGPEAGQTS